MSSDGAPPPAAAASPGQITAALQSAVRKQFELNGEVIPSAMRARVEQELGLADGFLKTDPHWKAECKTLIRTEFVSLFADSLSLSLSSGRPN